MGSSIALRARAGRGRGSGDSPGPGGRRLGVVQEWRAGGPGS